MPPMGWLSSGMIAAVAQALFCPYLHFVIEFVKPLPTGYYMGQTRYVHAGTVQQVHSLASFLFLYFSKPFFTEIYFQFHNLQFYTPTARQGAAGSYM